MADIFQCSSSNRKFTIIISKSKYQLDFLANRTRYFWNKLPNQIKNSKNVKNYKIQLIS